MTQEVCALRSLSRPCGATINIVVTSLTDSRVVHIYIYIGIAFGR